MSVLSWFVLAAAATIIVWVWIDAYRYHRRTGKLSDDLRRILDKHGRRTRKQ